MEDKLVDALYNTTPILDRYRKLQPMPMSQEELAAFRTKMDSFCDITKNWSKKSQKSGAHWQQGTPMEMLLRGGQLLHFNEKVKISYQGKRKEGGNGAIQKCFIENDPAIPKHWAFAAKTHKGDTPTVQKVRFNAEAMAVRSAHEGCIKWIAVHPTKSEGYSLWWNGGTIREMMRDEVQYNRESIHITLQVAFLIDSNDDYQNKLDVARRVEVFRKKRHKLAWTFLNTMNNVHHCHTLHNDMSPDNIMFHFLPNSVDKVYIGICNWAMAGNFNDLKESLYIHESQEARTRIMEHRWWDALELNYVLPPPESTRDPDFEWQPKFTPKSETYVVGKIAQWIYGGNLFLELYNKNHKEE
jgi:hypothetical protein